MIQLEFSRIVLSFSASLIMMITEMYIMIGGGDFLRTNAEPLSEVLQLTVGNVRPRGAKYVGLVLEALLRDYPSEGGALLLRTDVLMALLRSCASTFANDGEREPDRILCVYLNALARVLVASPCILDSVLPLCGNDNLGYSFGHSELVCACIRLYFSDLLISQCTLIFFFLFHFHSSSYNAI